MSRDSSNTTYPRRSRAGLALVAAALAALGACKDATHEQIDRWTQTQSGPEHLAETLADGELDVELRAHAAQNLVAIDRFSEVSGALEGMEEGERHSVVSALGPRLWEDAQLEERMEKPSSLQGEAKDALFEVREHADAETRDEIDEHLVEWLAGGYYEGRAGSGRISGRAIIRAIGADAAPALLTEARRIIAKPPDEDGQRLALGDRLLSGLAVTGSPDAVEFLLDVATGDDRGDETIAVRAMDALEGAYVDPSGIEPAPREGLHPHVDRLATLAQRSDVSGEFTNSAVRLIAAAGSPQCIQPLVTLIGIRRDEEAFRWMAAQQAVRCGGAEALGRVVQKLPPGERYRRGILEKYLWDEALSQDPEQRVAKTARALLSADSWVARGSGVELLGMVAIDESAREDASRLRELSGDSTPLRGWDDGPDGDKTRDPTLGERASEVAQALEKVAK